MVVIAVIMFVGLTAVNLLLARFIKTFGAYTQVLRDVHTNSVMIHERQERITEHLKRIGLRKREDVA